VMKRTSGIEKSERIRVLANHDGNCVVVKDLGAAGVHIVPEQNVFIHTVGTYSLGNLFVVYDINKQVYNNVRIEFH
jgi:hypothetical protein